MSDYIDIFDYKDEKYPFNIFIGGRGTGKTYSAMKGVLNLEKHCCDGKFIWMRRTQAEHELQLDTVKGEGMSDFKKINMDYGKNYGFKALTKYSAGLYEREENANGKMIHSGSPLGYAVSLTGVHNIRGINLSDCTDWIYDECIPETIAKKMKGEYDALMNAYESFNRNRELEGVKPITLYLLANSNDIYNPIFVGLGIVSICEKMVRKGKVHQYIPSRGLAIHILPPSEEFLKKKRETALYRLTAGTRFSDMALMNEFAYNDFSGICYKNVRGYQPIATLDNITIYRKKGDIEFYCSYAAARCPVYHSDIGSDARRFRAEIGVKLYAPFISGRLLFESYEIKEKVLSFVL